MGIDTMLVCDIAFHYAKATLASDLTESKRRLTAEIKSCASA